MYYAIEGWKLKNTLLRGEHKEALQIASNGGLSMGTNGWSKLYLFKHDYTHTLGIYMFVYEYIHV